MKIPRYGNKMLMVICPIPIFITKCLKIFLSENMSFFACIWILLKNISFVIFFYLSLLNDLSKIDYFVGKNTRFVRFTNLILFDVF